MAKNRKRRNSGVAGTSEDVEGGGVDEDGEKRVSLDTPYETLVWARVKGYPWWPAVIVPYKTVLFLRPNSSVPEPDTSKLVCQFLSDGRISLVDPTHIRLYHLHKNLVPPSHPFFDQVLHACAAAEAYEKCDDSKTRMVSADADEVANSDAIARALSSVKKDRDNAREEVATVRSLLQDAQETIHELKDELKDQVKEKEKRVKTLKKRNDELLAEQNRLKSRLRKKPGAIESAAVAAQNGDSNAESFALTTANSTAPISIPSRRKTPPRNRNKLESSVRKFSSRNARRAQGGRAVSSSHSKYDVRGVSWRRNNNSNENGTDNKRSSYRHTASSKAVSSASGSRRRKREEVAEEDVVILD